MAREIILKILGIFIIIAIGFLARKTGMVGEKAESTLSDLLFNILTPCMCIETMQEQEFDSDIINDTVWSFLSYTMIALLFGALSFLVMRAMKVKAEDRGIYRIQLVFTNVGFIGIPLTKVIFGEEAEFIILLINIAYIVLLYSFGVFLLLYQKGEKFFDKSAAKKMLNPPLICSLIGFLLFLTGIKLPPVINESLGMIGDMVVPAAMLIIGMQLCESSIRRMINGRNVVFSVISLIIEPLAVLGIGILLPQSDVVTLALTFAMAMPSGAMCAILAEQFKKDTLLASEGVALTTFFSLITLPVWAIVLTRILC